MHHIISPNVTSHGLNCVLSNRCCNPDPLSLRSGPYLEVGSTADGISYDEIILEYGGLLIQSDWCPYTMGKCGHRFGRMLCEMKAEIYKPQNTKDPSNPQERRERPATNLPGLRRNHPADALIAYFQPPERHFHHPFVIPLQQPWQSNTSAPQEAQPGVECVERCGGRRAHGSLKVWFSREGHEKLA